MSSRLGERVTAVIGGLADLAQEVTLAAMSATLTAMSAKFGTIGQKAMAGSAPVVIASDQSVLPIYGKRVARVEHRASAALPGAGAFTAHAAYTLPEGVVSVMFYITYTRGAAGGYPQFRVEFGNGTETECEDVLIGSTITEADPTGSVPSYQGRIIGPKVQTAAAHKWSYRVSVQGGPTTVALQAAEAGVAGTPGTLAIALTASY